MNVEFINPFIEAISNVLATMAMMEAKTEKISVKNDQLPTGEITGVIGMSSPQTRGTLAISFSTAVALDITQRMLGEEISSVDETVIDLVGEITNMTTGAAKAILEGKGYDFDLATPVVITGDNQKIAHTANGPVIVVPFTTDSGQFYVEICFENSPAKTK